MREGRCSNPAVASLLFGNSWKLRELRDDVIFTLLYFIPDTSALDFEEHLGHGLGKDADDTDIHDVAGNCEEEDFKRNRRRWLGAQKPLTGCKDWLVQPYKTERDHPKH